MPTSNIRVSFAPNWFTVTQLHSSPRSLPVLLPTIRSPPFILFSNLLITCISIVVAVTVEAGQDRKGNMMDVSSDTDAQGIPYTVPRPIRGILTTQGYSIPDPNVPNRLSIWFSGGSLEVQDEAKDVDEWKRIFDADSAPERDLREYANILAAKVLLGALVPEKLEADGTMNFSLKRPIGGHGSVYVDILFMDDTLRVMRGHHGSVYVCIRVPEPINSL